MKKRLALGITLSLVAVFFMLYYTRALSGPEATFWFFVVKGTLSTILMILGAMWAWRRTRNKQEKPLFLEKKGFPVWQKTIALIVVCGVVVSILYQPRNQNVASKNLASTKSRQLTSKNHLQTNSYTIIVVCDESESE